MPFHSQERHDCVIGLQSLLDVTREKWTIGPPWEQTRSGHSDRQERTQSDTDTTNFSEEVNCSRVVLQRCRDTANSRDTLDMAGRELHLEQVVRRGDGKGQGGLQDKRREEIHTGKVAIGG